MSAVPFDTLKLVKRLKEAGFTESQAEALADAGAEALHQGGRGLATKTDLAELKGEIQAMLNRHLISIIGAMVGLTAIFSAVLLIALRLIK